jgi:hypothetical protein
MLKFLVLINQILNITLVIGALWYSLCFMKCDLGSKIIIELRPESLATCEAVYVLF